jgi:hypothetical protein
MVAAVGRQAREAFQGVRDTQISLCASGDFQSVMGVAVGLVWLVLRECDEGPGRQGDHPVPAWDNRNGVISASAGSGQITACKRGFGQYRDGATRHSALLS